MTIPLDQISSMPAFSPYYPAPPARYRGARTHTVRFRADPAAVDALLPACLEPAPDGECVAWGTDAPWSSHYGAFQTAIVAVKCAYEDATGYFILVQFVNSRGSIPAGREIWGTPKVWADVNADFDERVIVTDARLAGTAVISIRSTMQRHSQPSDLPDFAPLWRLKVIPKADGPGAEVMQLIDGSDVNTDIVTHVLRAGDGVVEFKPTPVFDLSSLAPREYLGASYAERDFTEGYGRVVRDFLKDSGDRPG